MEYMVYIWLGAVVAFCVVELLTPQLLCIWFAVGAFAAMMLSILGAGLGWQISVFLLVSAGLLIATRPLYRKLVGRKITPTNTDALLGGDAVVTGAFDKVTGVGLVNVRGQVWSARTEGDLPNVGDTVRIDAVAGVHLIVSAK